MSTSARRPKAPTKTPTPAAKSVASRVEKLEAQVSTLTDLVSKLLAAQIAPVVQGRIESELRQKLAIGNVEDLAAGLAQARQQA